jgi:hypothetical protein
LARLEKSRLLVKTDFAASADGRFQFQKRRQLFIRVHDKTLSVAAMASTIRVLAFAINEIVGDQLPAFMRRKE